MYSGVLLRDVLTASGFAPATDRSARTSIVEAVASDGYRAVLSWGELFNSPLGDQAVVISAQDGKPLDAVAGPLALRSWPTCARVQDMCAISARWSCGVFDVALLHLTAPGRPGSGHPG